VPIGAQRRSGALMTRRRPAATEHRPRSGPRPAVAHLPRSSPARRAGRPSRRSTC